MLAPFPDSPNASWLNVDIAVEIINRMIAEQMSGLHEYCSPREQVGMSYEEYRQDPEYQNILLKLKNLEKRLHSCIKERIWKIF